MNKPTAKRGGRPTKQSHEKRSIQINLRITIAEDDYYRTQASKAGISVAEYLRRAGLNIDIRVPRPVADAELIDAVNRIGVNINQIARATNRGQDEHAYWRAIGDTCAEILDEIVKRL